MSTAKVFINFFVNNEEAQKVFNMELGIPGSSSIQNMIAENGMDPADQMATDYLNDISEIAPAFVPKAPGVWAIQDEISCTAESIAMGAMTTSDAAQHIVEIANEMIAENAQ